MGSFRGHAIPGSLFILVGTWHTLNSLFNFISAPSSSSSSSSPVKHHHQHRFHGRIWHPLPATTGPLRYLELYVITLGALFDLCIEFLYSPHFHYLSHGSLNPQHLNNFEHSAMLLMFFLLGLLGLLSESARILRLPPGALNIVAAMAFTAEFLLFYFHSTTHLGLEGRYHQLLVYFIAFCILFICLGAAYPESFIIDLAAGVSITLQGLWFYVVAMSLYGPWVPLGCRGFETGIKCEAAVYEIRGKSLANSQFNFLIVIVVTSVLLIYSIIARFRPKPQLHYVGLSTSTTTT